MLSRILSSTTFLRQVSWPKGADQRTIAVLYWRSFLSKYAKEKYRRAMNIYCECSICLSPSAYLISNKKTIIIVDQNENKG